MAGRIVDLAVGVWEVEGHELGKGVCEDVFPGAVIVVGLAHDALAGGAASPCAAQSRGQVRRAGKVEQGLAQGLQVVGGEGGDTLPVAAADGAQAALQLAQDQPHLSLVAF